MDPLPPIPSPPHHVWREFRIRFLPFVIFSAATLATVFLWKNHLGTSNVVGEVETTWAQVSSPKPGSLAELKVDRLQRVSAGEPLAQIVTTPPKVLEATLAVVRSEIDLIRAGLSPVQTQQRVLLDYERVRLDWMLQRVDLASDKIRLQQAESELQRARTLFEQRIIAAGGGGNDQIGLDVALRDRDLLVKQIEEKEKIATELQTTLESIFPQSVDPKKALTDALNVAINVQEEKLRLAEAELAPLTLVSPIDGLVSSIQHRAGENITAGEPILTISGARSDRIVAYIRQPFTIEAKAGMEVQVRSRNAPRASGVGKVLRVGSQLQPIEAYMLLNADPKHVEHGLPILVSIPPEMKLLPGEAVDLHLRN
jgi:HlyD family secretion protein